MILLTAKWNYALIYLDDIVVFFEERRGIHGPFREGIDATFDGRLNTELKTSELFPGKVDNLGHVIRLGRLDIVNHTAGAIRGLK